MPKIVTADVYIIGNKGIGIYKIGYSKNISKRLKFLRKHSPVSLDLFFSACVKDAEAVERRIHEFFRKQRAHGEWFHLKESDVCGASAKIGKTRKKQ